MRLTTLAAILLGLLPAAYAENRALLIGVGEYPKYPAARRLFGPPNDVAAVAEALRGKWNFTRITSVVNRDATRAGILAALDALIAETRKGDHVFVYYSGHGTSPYDPGTGGFGVSMDSGILVPSDVETGTPAQLAARLIVGSRDLRPRFLKLQEIAETLVVFDACYSGDTAKSIPALVSRSVDLAPRDLRDDYEKEMRRVMSRVETRADDYPYRNLVYISASAKFEVAWDIPPQAISGGQTTIDGKPHGVLTNALLYGLRGDADTDRDGRITYRELHEYLLQSVSSRRGQTPQLQPKGLDNPVVDQPVFGNSKAPRSNTRAAGRLWLAVKIDPPDPALKAKLTARPKIEITDGDYDILIARESRGYSMTHSSGSRFRSYALNEVDALVERVERQAQLQELVDWRDPSQSFNVRLDIDPKEDGVRYLGSCVQIGITPDRASWLMLVNVDVLGEVTVLYPYRTAEAALQTAGKRVQVVDSTIEQPVGTEVMKLLAFLDKPNGYEQWVGKQFSPESQEFNDFLDFLRQPGAGRSQTSKIMFSSDHNPVPPQPCKGPTQ
jgi:hypothetical protein